MATINRATFTALAVLKKIVLHHLGVQGGSMEFLGFEYTESNPPNPNSPGRMMHVISFQAVIPNPLGQKPGEISGTVSLFRYFKQVPDPDAPFLVQDVTFVIGGRTFSYDEKHALLQTV